jgi:hypothetical protein
VADSQSDIKQICRKTPDFIKVIPATPEPKFTESGPEPEFRPEFRRNFEPRTGMCQVLQICLPCSTALHLSIKICVHGELAFHTLVQLTSFKIRTARSKIPRVLSRKVHFVLSCAIRVLIRSVPGLGRLLSILPLPSTRYNCVGSFMFS